MNTPTITRAKLFTSLLLIFPLFSANADWKVDFSHHIQETRTQDLRGPASLDAPIEVLPAQFDQTSPPTLPTPAPTPIPAPTPTAVQAPAPSFLGSLFQNGSVAEEIVVLNTEKGFIPSTIKVKKGLAYEIHVVNVNEKDKNVSFVMDAFSEHHATYYGKIKTFVIRPQKVGVYRFESPETSAQGKLIVAPDATVENRLPASE